MLRIFEKVIFIVFFKSSEGFDFIVDSVNALADTVIPEHECILPNTWTPWMEHGTCESVTRTRNYKYYMCEYEIE